MKDDAAKLLKDFAYGEDLGIVVRIFKIKNVKLQIYAAQSRLDDQFIEIQPDGEDI